MKGSLESALADPISHGDLPAVWQPPTRLIPLPDLRDAIEHLEARLIPATLAEFNICMAAMLNALAIETTDHSTWEKRLEIYFTALNDIPPDLLERACLECIKSETFFPKAALVRAKIDAALKLRRNQLARANWLVSNRGTLTPGEAFEPEPEEVRLRGAIARWEKHRDSFYGLQLRRSAMVAEVRLAEIEDRAPADWAIEQAARPMPAPITKPPAPAAPPPTIEGDYVVQTAAHEPDDPSDVTTTAAHEEPPPRSGDELEW